MPGTMRCNSFVRLPGSSATVGAVGAWRGPWLKVDASAPPCVDLTLTPDPFGPTPPALVPLPGPEPYLVRLEAEP